MNRDLKWVILGVLTLIFFHSMALFSRFDRDASTLKNGFMYDHMLVQHSLVLGQHSRIGGLPLTPEQRWTRLLPMDMPGESGVQILDAMFRNRPYAEAVYRNQLPVGYVAGAVPALVFGPSFWTLRFGLLFPLACLLFWVSDMGRRLCGLKAGLYSAVLIGLLPCVWQSLFLSKIVLVNMTLVAGVLWSLLLMLQGQRWTGAFGFGILLLLATRSGEYVSDGLLCLAAILPVLSLQGGAMILKSIRQKKGAQLWPLVCGVVIALLSIDWPWLSSHGSSYVVAESGLEQSGFQFSQWVYNLQSYLWMFQYSLFLPAGAIVIGIGTIASIKTKPQMFVWGLLCAIGAGLVALSIPNKLQDYYMMPFVPAMIVLTGLGLSALKKWGDGIFVCAVMALGLSYGQGVFKPDADDSFWLTLDPALRGAPKTTAQAWFADWRRQEHQRQGQLRQELAQWLMAERSEWIAAMPSEAVVVIPWHTGNQTYDGMATILMALRPDVLVLNIDLDKKERVVSDILGAVQKSYWILVPQDAHRGFDQIIQGWGGELVSSHPEQGPNELAVYSLEASGDKK